MNNPKRSPKNSRRSSRPSKLSRRSSRPSKLSRRSRRPSKLSRRSSRPSKFSRRARKVNPAQPKKNKSKTSSDWSNYSSEITDYGRFSSQRSSPSIKTLWSQRSGQISPMNASSSISCALCATPATKEEYDNRLEYCRQKHPQYLCESCLRRLSQTKGATCPFCREKLIISFPDISPQSSVRSGGSLFRGRSPTSSERRATIWRGDNSSQRTSSSLSRSSRSSLRDSRSPTNRSSNSGYSFDGDVSMTKLPSSELRRNPNSQTITVEKFFDDDDELKLFKDCSDLVYQDKCPNFLKIVELVDDLDIRTERIYNRNLGDHLVRFLTAENVERKLKNYLLQIASALYVAQREALITFDRLDYSFNMILCATPISDTNHTYRVGNNMWNIPNIGQLVIIDQSEIAMPQYVSRDFYKSEQSVTQWRELLEDLRDYLQRRSRFLSSLETAALFVEFARPNSMKALKRKIDEMLNIQPSNSS